MKKIFHKNQIIVTTLALLVAVGGYLSFSLNQKDDKEASDTNLSYDISDEAVATDDVFTDTEDSSDEQDVTDPGQAVLASSTTGYENYIAKVKVNREQIRAKSKETLEDIINNDKLTEKSKADAVSALVTLTQNAQTESDIETLLGAKGFTDVVVSVDEKSVDVVLNMDSVTEAQRAQIEDIVTRKADVSVDAVVITPIRNSKTSDDTTSDSTNP